MLNRSDFDRSFERELSRTGKSNIGKPTLRSFEIDAQLPAAPNFNTDRTINSFAPGKNERTRHHAGSASKGFVFHAALVGAHQNLFRAVFLDEIHIRACRRKFLVTTQSFTPVENIDAVHFGNWYDHMRDAGVDEMNMFLCAVRGQIDSEL